MPFLTIYIYYQCLRMRDSAFFQKTSPINLLRIEIAVTKYKYLSQLALPIRKMFSSTEILHGPSSRICNFEFIDLGGREFISYCKFGDYQGNMLRTLV
jgi:hypothetical protein